MILNVENLTHGFGDRAIFNNVSFRLLAGEHIGLVGVETDIPIKLSGEEALKLKESADALKEILASLEL